jgi:hypothetical protein
VLPCCSVSAAARAFHSAYVGVGRAVVVCGCAWAAEADLTARQHIADGRCEPPATARRRNTASVERVRDVPQRPRAGLLHLSDDWHAALLFPGAAARRAPLSTGDVVYRHARRLGCEGIVSKRLGSRYRSGKCKDWIKMKNPVAPAVKREAEEDWGKERWR